MHTKSRIRSEMSAPVVRETATWGGTGICRRLLSRQECNDRGRRLLARAGGSARYLWEFGCFWPRSATACVDRTCSHCLSSMGSRNPRCGMLLSESVTRRVLGELARGLLNHARSVSGPCTAGGLSCGPLLSAAFMFVHSNRRNPVDGKAYPCHPLKSCGDLSWYISHLRAARGKIRVDIACFANHYVRT